MALKSRRYRKESTARQDEGMDSFTSTPRPSNYVGGGEATVSSFITFIILLAGVLGGLLIVICVILVCKYCLKSKKHHRRSLRDGCRDSGRAVRMLQRYETINSDVFSEPSSASVDGIPLSPRKPLDIRNRGRRDEGEEPTERTHLRSSYDKDHAYDQEGLVMPEKLSTCEQLTDSPAAHPGPEEGEEGRGSSPRASPRSGVQAEAGGGPGNRRVSFQLDNLPRLHSDQDKHQHPGHSHRTNRRYTEGDFHYLKHAKIHTKLPRQASLGQGPASAPIRALPLGAAPLPAFRYSLDERLRVLQEHGEGGELTEGSQYAQAERRSPPRLGERSAFHPVLRSSRPEFQHLQPDPTPDMLERGIGVGAYPGQTPSSGMRLSPSPPSPHRGDRWRGRPPSGSPSPPGEPVYRQINVEVHQQQGEETQGLQGAAQHDPMSKAAGVPVHVQRNNAYQFRKAASHSLEMVGPRRRPAGPTRKVKSYEDVADYDVLQITEFSRGPFYNTDYDVISEMASPTSSKVRYNDTGSLEQLNEETGGDSAGLALEALLPPDESDDTDTLNGAIQYRELWHLRATLEEEEECSDTIRMEDMTSPDDSPEREHVQTTSFESTAPSDACASDQRDSGIQWEGRSGQERREEDAALDRPQGQSGGGGGSGHGQGGGGGGAGAGGQLLHPHGHENRRQTYRKLLSGRLAMSPGVGPASAENSFDSVETDGDVSDTSRHEVTTTSFESTTDNTDSTTESQHSRLRQMQADSGYKSLETQHSGVRDASEALGSVEAGAEDREELHVDRQRRAGSGSEREDRRNGSGHSSGGEGSGNGSGRGHGNGARPEVTGGRRNSNAVHFERRAGRTASKKRREYSRERQVIHVYESINEPDADSRSDLHSGGSEAAAGEEARSRETRHHHHQPHHSHGNGHHPSASSSSHSHNHHHHSTSGSKRSVFTRFFSHHGREAREKYMARDYSIDEKTNQIFNEFLRQEVPREGGARLGLRRSPRGQHRPRLQRKHTEPLYGEDRRRDRLAPEMRSASLGSDSSASSVRRLSPQDSIEEEYEEEGEPEAGWSRTELPPMLEVGDGGAAESTKSVREITGAGREIPSNSREVSTTAAIHEIPIIKLPEGEDSQDTT